MVSVDGADSQAFNSISPSIPFIAGGQEPKQTLPLRNLSPDELIHPSLMLLKQLLWSQCLL